MTGKLNLQQEQQWFVCGYLGLPCYLKRELKGETSIATAVHPPLTTQPALLYSDHVTQRPNAKKDSILQGLPFFNDKNIQRKAVVSFMYLPLAESNPSRAELCSAPGSKALAGSLDRRWLVSEAVHIVIG